MNNADIKNIELDNKHAIHKERKLRKILINYWNNWLIFIVIAEKFYDILYENGNKNID